MHNAGQCLIQVYFLEIALRELESRAGSSRQGTDKTGSVMTKLKELKKWFMEDPEFREAYALADEEYALVETRIRERAAEDMMQTEVTPHSNTAR